MNMTTDTQEKSPSRKIHQGKGVKFVREALNISQVGFGELIGVTQQQVSRIELKEIIEDSMLEKIALAMQVPVELIKNYAPEEYAKNMISGNSINSRNYENSSNPVSGGVNEGVEIVESQTNQYQNDPQIAQLYQNIIDGKDKLLAEKDLRIAELQKLLDEKK